MTIHAEMKQAGIEIYHGECSLMVKDCPTARAILANYGVRVDGDNVHHSCLQINTVNGEDWLDLPERDQ